MPLLIDLKPGEKVIINGAVIENAGANTKLRLHNECNILRQKEILVAEDAGTPAARVYFCLQNAYIFPEKRDYYLDLFETCLSQYVEACPSAAQIAHDIRHELEQGHHYRALKASRKLLAHETALLDELQHNAEEFKRRVEEIAARSEAEAAQED